MFEILCFIALLQRWICIGDGCHSCEPFAPGVCCGCKRSCFPSTARVSLENGKSVMMSELRIGDKVQTCKSKIIMRVKMFSYMASLKEKSMIFLKWIYSFLPFTLNFALGTLLIEYYLPYFKWIYWLYNSSTFIIFNNNSYFLLT